MSHILIIEPAADLAEVLGRFLQQAGHTCHHATSAQQAISLADSQSPDAVILELALPAHNGVEFLYEFRSYSDWRDVPVILYTHVSAEESGLRPWQLRRLGITAHLYKPTTSLQNLQAALLDLPRPVAV